MKFSLAAVTPTALRRIRMRIIVMAADSTNDRRSHTLERMLVRVNTEIARRAAAPKSFAEFNATPATGPTYTDLAREVDRLKEEVATLHAESARIVNWKRVGESGQQAVLDFAHELAEMEPAARDAAIRRIIDNAQ